MTDVLFEITKDQLETGLRGVPVGYCTTSTVDPMKGLFYAGKPVTELSNWRPEEVIYLIMFGKKGSSKEIDQFFAQMAKRSMLKPETVKAIERLPREGHPMKLFSAALLIAGMLEITNDYQEDCLNLIAKAPYLSRSCHQSSCRVGPHADSSSGTGLHGKLCSDGESSPMPIRKN